jgi:putative transposase
MKKSRFSEEQIIGILREARGERTVRAVCAAHNIGVQTFYGWKRKYGGMKVNEARRLRSLEEENGRLKRVVADLTVQVQILIEVNAKKW